ncbi:histidine kinase [Pararobbsia alpina]|uniref:trifunctional serine/threonine-protein kinase/ATP-binding protein/sensor histidine kinase n=1 Tax=Pararobbsia alpina TaxID=621374 RepID=UPI0039A4B31A
MQRHECNGALTCDRDITPSLTMKIFDQTHRLVRGGELALYRSSSDADAHVLTVTTINDTPSEGQLALLRNEWALRDRIEPEWGCVPLEMTRLDQRVALVLSDPGTELLRVHTGSPMPLARFLPMAIALANMLRQAHAKGLVHCSVTPDNIWVAPDAACAWLTSFGRAHVIEDGPSFAAHRLVPSQLDVAYLPYMAPEFSGRMNRSVDARSDLYSLGLVFYELLTGTRAFGGHDVADWVNAHVTQRASFPQDRTPGLPAQVERIVLKLIAKAPEDRYQSASSLASDLARCSASFEAFGRVEPFPLDSADVIVGQATSRRLYGRDVEIEAIVAAVDRVAASGRSEFLLISGESGSGKSSLVRAANDRLGQRRRMFASGKFDDSVAIPFGGLLQALHGLTHQVLGCETAEFEQWKIVLSKALGAHGQSIVDLVPDLKRIVGEQPPIPHLPPLAERNRFLLLAARLISAFSSDGAPLILFMDDLQWCDMGTLEVIRFLVTDPTCRNLLLIGAYRTNEVAPDHPLRTGFEGIAIEHRSITLGPLESADLVSLVSDVLHCSLQDAEPLAELVRDKTRGDPFFTIQFLEALLAEGLVSFDHSVQTWKWDISGIRSKGYSSNVVDLLLGRLHSLSGETRSLLQCLTCLGSGAATRTLSVAAAVPADYLHAALAEACAANLVYRDGDGYAFWHDRIREAAYQIVPPDERQSLHLNIGRRLLAIAEEASNDVVFETVNQINLGVNLVDTASERRRFATLNLTAGRRAKAATAYVSALSYLTAAAQLLAATDEQDETRDEIELHRAECEYLTNALELAEARFKRLSERPISLTLRADLTRLQAALYTTIGKTGQALNVGLDFLGRVGFHMTARPSDEDVDREYRYAMALLGGRPVEAMRDLPIMQDTTMRGTMSVLADMVPAALFTDANLHDLLRLRMLSLSLEYGHCDASAYGYVCPIIGFRYGDYDSASKLGELSRYLIREKGLSRYQIRSEMSYATLVLPWARSVREGQIIMRHAMLGAAESGDITFEIYSRRNLLSNLIFAGSTLDEMEREAEIGMAFSAEKKFALVVDAHLAQIVMFRKLRGKPNDEQTLLSEGFDKDWVLRYAQRGESSRAIAAFSQLAHEQCACMVFADVRGAIEAEERAKAFYWGSRGFLETAEHHFYGALARAGILRTCEPDEREAHRAALTAHMALLRTWDSHCPDNFGCRLALAEAEVAHTEGRMLDAERDYEVAIRRARSHGFLQVEAIANDLAAAFYLSRGLETIAFVYLRSARNAYRYWGADAKVAEIDARYAQDMTAQIIYAGIDADGPTIETILDVRAVVEASHALSSEIIQDRLLRSLLSIALEHAGARRCLLALIRDGELRIEARAEVDETEIRFNLTAVPLAEADCARSLLLTCARLQSAIVLDDADVSAAYQHDTYIRAVRPRSVLCVPLVKQGELVGVLYMENNLAPGVFTPERTAVLDVIASQAAISLENARLYDNLLAENRQRAEVEQELRIFRHEMARVARLTTMGQLVASIVHEVSQPMTAIGTAANVALRWLGRATPDIGEAQTMLERIVMDSARASDVIRGLRSLAKKADPERVEFDINKSISEVLALVRSELDHGRVNLNTVGLREIVLINGDRVQIQQVVLNLVMNAIEAMSMSERTPRVLSISSTTDSEGRIRVSVEDSGDGIDESIAEHVFDPFVTSKPTGMGMGLSICRSIVDAHGGALTIGQSDLGGAQFTFALAISESAR